MTPFKFRAGDDVRALWLAAVFVTGAGVYFANTRCEPAIRQAHQQTELLYRKTAANERTLQQARSLRRIEAQATRDLRSISHDRDLATTTATLLQTLDSAGRDARVTIESIEPSQSPGAADSYLAATDLAIRVRGTFRDILRFVADVPRHATLLAVSSAQVALVQQHTNGSAVMLDATIHATLYRLGPLTEEIGRAPR